MNRPAVFLDRDGTLVHARHYPRLPEELVLCDGVVERLAALKAAGFALVMITNQSGIARGYFTPAALERMHRHLQTQLAAGGAELDGMYACPHHPEGTLPEFAVECDCRKPRPGMPRRAALDLHLDLTRSWFVGDILDDVEAGNSAGCRTILVDLGTESLSREPPRTPTFVARTTAHALDIIRFREGIGPPSELSFRPATWAESKDRSMTVAAGTRPRHAWPEELT